MTVRVSSMVALLAIAGFTHQASAQGLFDILLKTAADGAAKAAADSIAAKTGVPAGGVATANALVPVGAQGQQVAIGDPGCKKGQLINPYYVMLQANLLPDASLADNSCVSTTQLQGLHGKYSKFTVK